MTNKNTKRTLVTNILALVLCVSMFVGTTFAWFTDTASTNVNTIQAGTLKVGLQKLVGENWVDAKGQTVGFVDQDENDLWEPGVTYRLENLKVVNAGTLALKYKVLMRAETMTEGLADVITVKVGNNSAITLREALIDGLAIGAEGNLLAANAEVELGNIEFHMLESAGNDYQGATIDGISVLVVATQYTHEADSKDNKYDATAEYPTFDATSLKNALTTGGIINVGQNINVTDESAEAKNIITADTTINFENNVVTLDLPNATSTTANWKGLDIQTGNVVLDGSNGGVKTADNKELYAINIGVKTAEVGANVTIKGGNYYGGTTAVQVSKGTLTIEGGTFESFTDNGKWVLNCVDANYKNGTAKIIVKGGTFINFNPANNTAEGVDTNYVAEGYKVVSEAHGEDTWYKVVAE